MPKVTYVALDHLDWSGHGGRHLTAHLTFEKRERVELERAISLREAKVLYPDHSDRVYMMPHYRKTNRFDSWVQLILYATLWCQANIKGPWILLKYDTGDLRRILAHEGVSETRVRILNLIEEQWDRLTNPERDNETMDTFYAMWREWKI